MGTTLIKNPVELKKQRAALVLVDMEGYSVAEAAEILGRAPGTIKAAARASAHGRCRC